MTAVIDVWQHTHWDEVVLGTAAVIVAIGLIWRKAIRPALDAFGQMSEAWHWVEAQLKPNGGESIRDRIDALASAHAVSADERATLGARLADVSTALDRVQEALKTLPSLSDRLAQLEREVLELRSAR